MNTQLSITNILSSAFKIFSKNWIKIILAQLFVAVVILIPLIFLASTFFFVFGVDASKMLPGFGLSKSLEAIVMITLLFCFIFYIIYTQAGLIRFYLDIYKGGQPKITSILKTNKKVFCAYLVFSVALFFIILGGFILLIVPAVIFGLMFSLSRFYVIEKGFKTKQALDASKDATKGHRVEIFLFVLTMFALYIVTSVTGSLGELISYFVLQPVFLLSFVYIYTLLSQKTSVVSTETTEKKAESTDVIVQPQELESGHQEDNK